MSDAINVPANWASDTLINIADYHNGAAFKPKDWVEDGLPIIRIEQLNKADSETDKYGGVLLPNNFIDTGDLIFSWSATLKVVIWSRGPGALNQHLYKVVPKPWINRLMLLHVLDFNMSKLAGQSQGSTMKHVTRKELSRFKVVYPKREPEQQKIATILSTIDQTIEKTEALIEKYQQIKAGLMHDLFTRGIGADGKLRPPREQAPELYQQTPIGWIPKEWKPLKLNDILKNSGGYLQTGPFGSQLHSYEYTYEGIPVVMPQDINDGIIDEIQIARIPERRAQSLLKHRLKIGDIIIARRGELSRAAAITGIEQGWVCGTGCFLLRLGGSNLDARFFSLIYRHPMAQRQVEGLAVGSTMPSLNNDIMSKLTFPYMSKAEQTAIADKVQLTEMRMTTLNSELTKLQKQKSGLMRDLLTGKVSVQVAESEPEIA